MVRLAAVVFLASAVLAPLLSAQIRFEPAAPDTRSWITARVFGTWCGITDPEVTVTGNQIDVYVTSVAEVCPAIYPTPGAYAQIGRLPGGVYNVRVSGRAIPETATLVVRDTRKVRLIPSGAPTSGGIPVSILATNGLPIDSAINARGRLQVQFGDAAPQDVQSLSDRLVVTPPAHGAGTVDVRILAGSGSGSEVVVEAAAAFTYYDASDRRPDSSIFEPLLFPIAYEGPGAFGSQWKTDNWLSAAGFQPGPYFHAPPCRTCSNPVTGRIRLDASSLPSGVILWPARGTMETIGASSRVCDRSRQAESAGTYVPIARESDFVSMHRFVDVPTAPGSRAMLRVWMLDDGAADSFVYAGTLSGRTVGIPMSSVQGSGMLFGSIDLTEMLRSATGPSVEVVLRGNFDRAWGLISVTNNDTQQVTIIAPRHGVTGER
jgi:hypothetical protein